MKPSLAVLFLAVLILATAAATNQPPRIDPLAAINSRLAVLSNSVAKVDGRIAALQNVIDARIGRPEKERAPRNESAYDRRFRLHVAYRYTEAAMKTPEFKQIQQLQRSKQPLLDEIRRLDVARAQLLANAGAFGTSAAPSGPQKSSR